MAKKPKIQTPDWILKGDDSKKPKKKKGKTFKVRKCPECDSDKIQVVMGEVGSWKCSKCKFKGKEVKEVEFEEEEFMKYLDEKGEKVA